MNALDAYFEGLEKRSAELEAKLNRLEKKVYNLPDNVVMGEPSGEKKWKPKKDEVVFCIMCDGRVTDWVCNYDHTDNDMLLYFKTRSEAEAFLSKIKALREE